MRCLKVLGIRLANWNLEIEIGIWLGKKTGDETKENKMSGRSFSVYPFPFPY